MRGTIGKTVVSLLLVFSQNIWGLLEVIYGALCRSISWGKFQKNVKLHFVMIIVL